MNRILPLCILGLFALPVYQSFSEETLAPLNGKAAPRTHAELWVGFDPRVEPLEVEVLREWEEEGVILQVLRYRIGIFKGQKAMMAAVYGYPKGGTDLPGLVQIHGGGQYADYRAPLTNAKRGYATISISWAGRINAPDYKVTPSEVKLFWDKQTNDPNYKLTTDWGALDAYHAPRRHDQVGFGGTKPAEWSLDPVESERNNPWFLCTLGARRALTFLERRPEVDPSKLGVYGHSMGGKLTVLTAGADNRVQAAAPSCGGISDLSEKTDEPLSPNADDAGLAEITCPILFQSPSNDFHGRIDDLPSAIEAIKSKAWRATCSPHHNHQDTPSYEALSQLWFDQYLKGTFTFPKTPQLAVNLKTENGVPTASVTVDASMPILEVDVYYTRHGQPEDPRQHRENTKNRFWHHAPTTQHGAHWHAQLPLSQTRKPLWVFANVTYQLKEPVAYAGYYYRIGSSETLTLSSLMFAASSDELKAAGAKATLHPSTIIESFEDTWEKQWFTYRPEEWGRKTHKVYDDVWKAPAGTALSIEVKVEKTNSLVVTIDHHGAEVSLKGGSEWHTVSLAPERFSDASGEELHDWNGIRQLGLEASANLKKRVDGKNTNLKLGGSWKGAPPEFRRLQWIPSSKTP